MSAFLLICAHGQSGAEEGHVSPAFKTSADTALTASARRILFGTDTKGAGSLLVLLLLFFLSYPTRRV